MACRRIPSYVLDDSTRRLPGGVGGTGVTGRPDTVLIVVRGPSGAGKSSTGAGLRAAYGRGIALVGQDVLRRGVLRERDVAGGANITLIDLVAASSPSTGPCLPTGTGSRTTRCRRSRTAGPAAANQTRHELLVVPAQRAQMTKTSMAISTMAQNG